MLRIRLRFNHWLPQILRVQAIVLYPYTFFSQRKEDVHHEIICHEMIHIRQIRNLGPIRFYSHYLWQYLDNFLRSGNHFKAYFNISFEKEAYQQQKTIVLTEREKQELQLS